MVKITINFIVVVLVLATILVGFSVTGCSSSGGTTIQIVSEFDMPPEEITVEKMYGDYLANQTAADAIYKGKKFLFTNIKAEKIESPFLNPRATETWIMYKSVRFRANYPNDLDGYKEGFVVDIVGVVQGMSVGDILVIRDCWFNVVEGDLVKGPPPAY